MKENKMEEVAKLLGVELGEEFKIEGFNLNIYKIEKDDGLIFWSNPGQKWLNSGLLGDLLAGKARIVKLPKQILTYAEKRYLANVIEPFRDKVNCIIKRENSMGEYIEIYSCHHTDWFDVTMLPEFEKETMYKGMKINERYTLDKLGL